MRCRFQIANIHFNNIELGMYMLFYVKPASLLQIDVFLFFSLNDIYLTYSYN